MLSEDKAKLLKIAAYESPKVFKKGEPDTAFDPGDYMRLLISECDLCGESTQYNYMEPIDDSSPLGKKNCLAVCIHCKALKGDKSKEGFKKFAKDKTKDKTKE